MRLSSRCKNDPYAKPSGDPYVAIVLEGKPHKAQFPSPVTQIVPGRVLENLANRQNGRQRKKQWASANLACPE
jgi:hypothetical protein